MVLGTLSRTVFSIVRKRGLLVAAATACAQLWSPGGAKATAPADPSSVFGSCFETSIYPLDGYYVNAYAQWDASPYSASDKMYFYFGAGVTEIGSDFWAVYQDATGSGDGLRWTWADDDSDSFIPYDSDGNPVVYVANGSYEMGCQAVNSSDEASNIVVVSVVQNT